MGFGNGYDSGYSDAIEDVRNGKVPGIGPTAGGGGAQKKYAAVIVEGGMVGMANLAALPEGDVLRVTMADLGVDTASSDPQTMDFGLIADRLAPVVAFNIFWNVSSGTEVSVTGPEGYNWEYLAESIYPGSGVAVALSAAGDTFPVS